VGALKELNDKADAEERDLTTDEQQEYDRIESDFESLTRRIERQEKLEGLAPGLRAHQKVDGDIEWTELDDEERKIPDWLPEQMKRNLERAKREGRKAPESFKEFNELRAVPKPQDDPEYRWAFFHYITAGDLRELDPRELRVLSKATAAAGANLVPTTFQRELIQALRDFGVVRRVARVITTTSGEALQYPSVTAHGTASWIAENGAYATSDEAFGQLTLNAYKAGTMMQVSEELLQDSAFDLDGYVRNEFGQRIGVLENTGYTVGDGIGKPSGWNNNATVGVTAATGNTTTIPADNLFDLIHSILPPYRPGSVFVGNDAAIKALRKLKDTTNQYLWAPGLTAGAPDTILSYPVYADPDVPAPAANARSLGFGNFQQGYTIRDVDGIAMQRLNELYAANGQVGYRAYHRTEGKITNASAIKVFVNSAT
jgi:HK97 family phage major capsid protein